MPRSQDRKPARSTWVALGIALLFHAGLLMLPLPQPGRDDDEPEALTVELIAPASDAEPERGPDAIRPVRPATAPGTETRPKTRPDETVAASEEGDSAPDPIDDPATRRTGPNSASSERLRASVLAEAGEIGRDQERAERKPGLDYGKLPELPGRDGWLHRHTGRVTPSIDRWRAGDGSRSARLVTGSGRVVCVRSRAPTMDEIFNPWQSTAVPMMRDCGRERPTLDAGDPWLRRPGPVAGDE